MELDKILTTRKSVRSYTKEPISDAALEAILKAAQAAPVGMGKYGSLHLTVVRDKAHLEAIDASAQKAFQSDHAFLYGAPLMILVSATGEENLDHSNAAIVAHQMTLAAVDQGVGTCHIWGASIALQKNEDLMKELGIPDGFTPLCGAVFGLTDEEYTERNDLDGRIEVNEA